MRGRSCMSRGAASALLRLTMLSSCRKTSTSRCNSYQPMPSSEDYLEEQVYQLPFLRLAYLEMRTDLLKDLGAIITKAAAAGIGGSLLAPPTFGRAACARFDSLNGCDVPCRSESCMRISARPGPGARPGKLPGCGHLLA